MLKINNDIKILIFLTKFNHQSVKVDQHPHNCRRLIFGLHKYFIVLRSSHFIIAT